MKFKYEQPTLKRKQDAIEFINEFFKYNSSIHGVAGLNHYLDNYEGWLEKLEEDSTRGVTKEKVPARTYFFVRVDDNKIVGMTDIRLKLNKKLMDFGRNIGYSIRPIERGNGYNKINLYLALKKCKEFGMKKVLLDVDGNNPASWRTMEALGAKLDSEEKSIFEGHDTVRFYSIDVEKSLKKFKDVYENMVE